MDNAELNDFVEKVRERSDIFSVVSRYTKLNLKSGKYWARCPFHNEKTASFTVTPEKGLFYCFGCHVGGNVFKFISLIENVSYFEAIKLQAERLGIPLPNKKKSPQEIQRDNEEKILYKLNELAKKFYCHCLTETAEGEAGRKYLNSRGISTSTIENFQFGYAPNAWDSLANELMKRGFTQEQLLKAGLVSAKKSGDGVYDRMRGRVIIPIADVFGHVVGFGGRILNADDEKNSPKYLNSPETILFNKRQLLFGLDRAHRAISSANCAIVVEGYMDAISLVSAGIENVVATLGTAFTAEHAKLIVRYARKIIFCYDSDEAGQRATMRALPIVRDAGFQVSIITVPDGKDPDDFIRKHGKEAFDKLIKNAASVIDYRLKYILRTTEHSTLGGKLDVLRKVLPVVAEMKDSAVESEYRKKLSAVLMLEESVVSDEWKKFSALQTTPQESSQVVKPVKSSAKETEESIQRAGETILRVVWNEVGLVEYVLGLVPKEIFSELHREIISYFEKCFAEDKQPSDMDAAVELSEQAISEMARIFSNDGEEFKDAEVKAFEDSVRTLRIANLKKIYEQKVKDAKSYMLNDKTVFLQKMQESLKIKNEMDEL